MYIIKVDNDRVTGDLSTIYRFLQSNILIDRGRSGGGWGVPAPKTGWEKEEDEIKSG